MVMSSVVERFWPKVEKTEGCWNWKAAIDSTGYGRFSLTHKEQVVAHRFAYEQSIGPIPDGLFLDHLCRNRACVNPQHLEVVTTRENILRGVAPTAINAHKTHCKRGHPLEGNNLDKCNLKRGQRACRTCANIATAEWRLRKQAELGQKPKGMEKKAF